MRRALVALILAVPLVVPAGLSAQSDFLTTRFERYLDALRKQAGIPGPCGPIVQDDRIVWERAWGYQDLDANIPTSPDTPFYIADLTSTLSATLVLQCIEQGKVRLDQTVQVPPALPAGNGPTFATVYDLLSHSTAGAERLPLRSGAVCGLDQRDRAMHRGQPEGGNRTPVAAAPRDDAVGARTGRGDDRTIRLRTKKSSNVSVAGAPDGEAVSCRPSRPGVAVAVSRVDARCGLRSRLQRLATSRASRSRSKRCRCSTKTRLPPHGRRRAPRARSSASAGSSRQYHGQPVVWHFGYAPDASSALFIHLPARHKTLILLANSDGLAAAFSLAERRRHASRPTRVCS